MSAKQIKKRIKFIPTKRFNDVGQANTKRIKSIPTKRFNDVGKANEKKNKIYSNKTV